MTALTNYRKLGDLKWQKFILSLFYSPEIQNQSVLFPKVLGENPYLASSSFWWLQAFLDLWWQHSNFCLHGHIASSSSLCVYLPCVFQSSLPFSYKNTCDKFRAHLDNPG